MKFGSKILISLIVLIFIIIGTLYVFSSKQKIQTENLPTTQDLSKTTTENMNYQASFAIYTNGTFRIFTDSKYHNLSDDVYIESADPNVVNIKKAGMTWKNFFETLPMKLGRDCLTTGTGQIFCSDQNYILQFFINGVKDPNALEKTINPNDKLLVTYEREEAVIIREQIDSVPTVE